MNNSHDFFNSYIPNNHWLSKSMELTKIETCGTYWYIKKLLVYYYYIFIQKRLGIKEIDEIIANFDSYIKSLSSSAKADAEKFFYQIDIRDKKNIITLQQMCNYVTGFETDEEITRARKYYFSYIMELKGQNPKKDAILQCVIKEKNYFKGIERARATLIPTIISHEEFDTMSSDVHAFLRNQRQILLLYGIVNSNEEEACSPTSIGLLMFNANFNEMILLMEVQKIKQVSRNPLVYYGEGFNRPRDRKFNKNANYDDILSNFNIKRHPYLFYLKYLVKNKSLTLKEYRYLVARTTDNDSDEDALNMFNSSIEEIKTKVITKDNIYLYAGANNRKNEPIGPEDFSKVNKQFWLGLTNLNNDYDQSLFLFAKLNGTTIQICNKDKAEKIKDMYERLTMYLDLHYEGLYQTIVEEQKKKYKANSAHEKFEKGSNEHLDVLEEWINYYNSSDPELMRIILVEMIKVFGLSYDEMYLNFPNILQKCMKISKKNRIDLLSYLENSELKRETEQFVIPGQITKAMLEEESKKYKTIFDDFNLPRERNVRLIRLYKHWCIQQKNNRCHCEACGNELDKSEDKIPACHIHHLIPFNEDSALGPDDYENLVMVCPNCHTKLHKTRNVDILDSLFRNIEKYNYLNINMSDRIKNMKEKNILYESCLEYARRKKIIK